MPSSEKKICCTPCFRQFLVQAFISGSSTIFVPCCMLTHACVHLFSSTEWHMHRQHNARSFGGTGREMPVSGKDATTTARRANLGLRFIEVRNRYVSQIKVLIRCILRPFRPLRQITVVISRRRFYAQLRSVVSGSFRMSEVPMPVPVSRANSGTSC